jgi:glycosyltransferase involved in cell wall biosynthesis
MKTTTVILDQVVAPVPGGIGRYALNLVRALTARVDGIRSLVGFVPRVSHDAVRQIEGFIPLLEGVNVSPFPRAVLARAWERGVAVPKHGVTYSPSLFAPLAEYGQHIVTIHDAVPWTHPETLTSRGARWHRAMGERAQRFADIVVVPTDAVASRISTFLSLGDRIRVIGGAPTSDLIVPVDSENRRFALGLPDVYITFVGTLEPRKGLEQLLVALATIEGLSLVVIGPQGWGGVSVDDLVTRTGIAPHRVHALGRLGDSDLAAVLSASRGLVVPSIEEGFGLPVLEAMSLGVPVVHSTAEALREVAGQSAIAVDVHGKNGTIKLAEALTGLNDETLRRDLASRGRARAAQFSWDASAARLESVFEELS